ncbi:MAG: Rrf2 family transcriptional regulator [Oscillospiraceae bacterium]|nr:Rrf2 family transcriptional regulator [Oscillospiraceae bacterium]
MMISTRGRYALRVLIDLAEHNNGKYIPMKDVAERQEISLKYLERILPVLVKNGLVEGVHGKGGGYKLNRSPEKYTVGEILRLTEGNLAPVACLGCEAEPCRKSSTCKTISMWNEFYSITNRYFDGITIADLVNENQKSEVQATNR